MRYVALAPGSGNMPRRVSTVKHEDAERFRARVRECPASSCWLWVGAKFQNGYGEFRISGKKVGAHRASWQIYKGQIPDGLCVLHNCPDGDNRLCVNPAHLFLGTKGDNIKDCVAKGRNTAGPTHHSSKKVDHLTSTDLVIMQRLYSEGMILKDIASGFSVSISFVHTIVRKTTWRDR